MELIVAVMLFLVSGTHHAPPIQEGAVKYDKLFTSKQKECLLKNLWHEARGETPSGILWVSQTTLNRVKDHKFPRNLCGVVYQKGAFSWNLTPLKDRRINPINNLEFKAYEKIKLIIQVTEVLYLLDIDITQGSLYYHTKGAQVYWAAHKQKINIVGNHIFYKDVK